MTLAYLPWLLNMRTAFGRVLHAAPYAVTQNPFLEQLIRLLYLALSFTFGETVPAWVMAGGVLLAPAIVAQMWRAARNPPQWLPMVALAAAIGYTAAGRWVGFAFVPARLLFVLPFYLQLLTRRAWISTALACLWIGSLYSYFHQEDFLNKGYLLPFDQIADIIERESAGRGAQLIIEAPGLDVSPLTRRLPSITAANPNAEIIWYLSNRGSRGAPPGAIEIQRQKFVAYSEKDRWIMNLLNWKARPNYALELTEYHRGAAPWPRRPLRPALRKVHAPVIQVWRATCSIPAMLDAIATKLEHYIDLLGKRQQLVTANIANADTPGYTTKDIDFQFEFMSQMECGPPNVIDAPNLPTKNDGNNVDMERESRLLAENALRFNLAYEPVARRDPQCPFRHSGRKIR